MAAAGWVLLMPSLGWSAGIRDVPVVNWSYFSANRDWTYDAVQKLVDSGLAGPVIFNVKPMTRREMARIVLRVVDRIRTDPDNNHNERKDMEGLLMSLIEEFRPELRSLGFHHDVTEGPEPSAFTLQPVEKVQVRSLFAGNGSRLENQHGEISRGGGNVRVAFNGWAEAGGYAAAYVHPEFFGSGEDRRFRIVEGYASVGYGNVDLTVGRQATWWGPGYHGSMWFSNNAQPPWMVQVRSQEAFELPGFLRPLGQFKLVFHVMRLDKDQVFPRPYVTSARLSWSPSSFLELGFGRSITFGGQGRPAVRGGDFPRIFFGAGDLSDPNNKFDSDSRGSVDATLRLHDVDRFFPLTKDVEIYGEIQIDDTKGNPAILPNQPGYLVGAYFPNLFGSSRSDLRIEYAYTSPISFTNFLYTSGFEYKGFPLAHFIGTGGRDLYVRVSRWIDERIQVASELGFSTLRPTNYHEAPRRRQTLQYGGVDVSYAYSPSLRFRLGFQMRHVENLGFVPGRDRTFPVFRLEGTYDFGARR